MAKHIVKIYEWKVAAAEQFMTLYRAHTLAWVYRNINCHHLSKVEKWEKNGAAIWHNVRLHEVMQPKAWNAKKPQFLQNWRFSFKEKLQLGLLVLYL